MKVFVTGVGGQLGYDVMNELKRRGHEAIGSDIIDTADIQLDITDRAISKWECGKSLPDSSIMFELCEILDISVNELLTGEKLEINNYNSKAELNLITMARQKEESDKMLLKMEIVIGVLAGLVLFILIFVASFVEMADWLRILLIITGLIPFMIGILFAIRIEQTAGYYECNNCHHKYVPTFSSVLWSMHFGRTRYMKCPECGKKSWQKKVISIE